MDSGMGVFLHGVLPGSGEQCVSEGTENHYSGYVGRWSVRSHHCEQQGIAKLDQSRDSPDFNDNPDPFNRKVTRVNYEIYNLLSDYEQFINVGMMTAGDIPVIDSNQQMTAASDSPVSIDQNGTVDVNRENPFFSIPGKNGLSKTVKSSHSIVFTDDEYGADLDVDKDFSQCFEGALDVDDLSSFFSDLETLFPLDELVSGDDQMDVCDLFSTCQDGVSQPPAKNGNNFPFTMDEECQLGALVAQMEGVTSEEYQDQNNPLPENANFTDNEMNFLEHLSEIDFLCDPGNEGPGESQEVAHLKAQVAEIQGQCESQEKKFQDLDANYGSCKDKWQCQVQKNMVFKAQCQKKVRENEVLQLAQSDDRHVSKAKQGKYQCPLCQGDSEDSTDSVNAFSNNKIIIGQMDSKAGFTNHLLATHHNQTDRGLLARKLIEWLTDDTASNVDMSKNKTFSVLMERQFLMNTEGGWTCCLICQGRSALKNHQQQVHKASPSTPSGTMKLDSGNTGIQYKESPFKPDINDQVKKFSVWCREIGYENIELTWVGLITICLQRDNLSLDNLVKAIIRKLSEPQLPLDRFKEKISHYLNSYDCFTDISSRGGLVKAQGGFWKYAESQVTNTKGRIG